MGDAPAVVATVADGAVAVTLVGGSGGTPAAEARFPVYSITKTLIAAAVMSAVEQGRVGLDDPARTWFDDVDLDPRITVRQLLDHTAGVPDYGSSPGYAGALREQPLQPWTRAEFLDRTLGAGLVFEPGTGWAYSNVGYLLLVMMLERVHGAPIADVLRRALFEPLELRSTDVATSPADLAGLTPATSTALSPDATPVDVATHYHPGWVAHGLVVSTAAELALLVDAVLGGRLLAPGTVATMAEPVLLPFAHPLFSRPGSGLGLMVDAAADGLLVGHGGGGPGYSTGAIRRVARGRAVTAVALAVTETADTGLALALRAASAPPPAP